MKADADDVRKSICLIQKTLTSRTARTTHHLKGRKRGKSESAREKVQIAFLLHRK